MTLKLNKLQRMILFLGGVAILVATYGQQVEDGYENITWILPVGVAVIMLLFSLSSPASQNTEPKSETFPLVSVSKLIDPNDVTSLVVGLREVIAIAIDLVPRRAFEQGIKTDPRSNNVRIIESDTRFRIYAYAMLIIQLAAYRLEPKFFELKVNKQFLNVATSLLKTAWLHRHGSEAKDFPNELSRDNYGSRSMDIAQIQINMLRDMAEANDTFMLPLFRYLHQDSSATPTALKAKYDKPTKDILINLTR